MSNAVRRKAVAVESGGLDDALCLCQVWEPEYLSRRVEGRKHAFVDWPSAVGQPRADLEVGWVKRDTHDVAGSQQITRDFADRVGPQEERNVQMNDWRHRIRHALCRMLQRAPPAKGKNHGEGADVGNAPCQAPRVGPRRSRRVRAARSPTGSRSFVLGPREKVAPAW